MKILGPEGRVPGAGQKAPSWRYRPIRRYTNGLCETAPYHVQGEERERKKGRKKEKKKKKARRRSQAIDQWLSDTDCVPLHSMYRVRNGYVRKLAPGSISTASSDAEKTSRTTIFVDLRRVEDMEHNQGLFIGRSILKHGECIVQYAN
jgi:hypothetical protein